MKKHLKKIIIALAGLIVMVLAGLTFTINLGGGKAITISIEKADKKVPALLTDENGEDIELEVETVKNVDAEIISVEEPGGQGKFIYAPTDSPIAFKDYTLGHCYNTDDHYGAQCWDLGDLFWQNYAGRRLSTCGTGAAKGIWKCKEEVAGDDFELITDPKSLQAGDWIIFTNGKYGHIGMALGDYNKGYIALLGQNQGGSACEQGGSATNIINISLKSFAGAFRPKAYVIPPAPAPAPVAPNTIEYTYKKGDQFGKVLLNNGLANPKNLWGKSGKVEEYNKQLEKQGLVVYRNGKYYGNIPVGKTIKLEK